MKLMDHEWALDEDGSEPEIDEFDPDLEYERRRDERLERGGDAA